MALVSSADFDTLSIEPIPRWLELRDLVESRLASVTDEREGASADHLVEYCMVLTSAAEELELGSFDHFAIDSIREHYPSVRSEIIRLATKLSMRSSTSNAAYSVALPRASKANLLIQIERLRVIIANSDLLDVSKKKLLARLDELQTIVLAKRTEFSKAMLAVGALAAGLATTTAFLADVPAAIATITAIIGEAKEAETEEKLLLQAEKEPLLLQDQRDDGIRNDDFPF